MKKITLLVVALCATIFASATNITATAAAWGTDGSADAPHQQLTKTFGSVTITIDSAYCNGTAIRVYSAAKVVFTSTENIKSIVVTTNSEKGNAENFTAESGYTASSTTGTWTGSATSVTLTAGKQIRVLQFAIVTDGEGGDVGKVDTLTVSVADAVAAAEALADNAMSQDYYIISGVVSDIDDITAYGNATFTLTEDASSLLIYRAYNLGNVKFTDASELTNGDEVKLFGQLKKYVKDSSTTLELVSCYLLERKAATAVSNIEIDENVYARDGRIYAEEGAHIYTLTGLDVTRQNGSLNGVYVVCNGNKVAKVVVR